MSTSQPPTIGVRLTDYENPNSFGSRFRRRRTGPLMDLIRTAHAKYGEVKLLDVGGRKLYWNILPPDFLKQHQVKVTLLNIPSDLLGGDDETFTHVAGDACNMPEFADRTFHIAHSNSVIEHVGGWPRVKNFAKEVRRVANGLFVQTPYFWFPIEPHYVCPFFHWTPRTIQESLVLNFALGHRGTKAASLDAAIAEIDEVPRLLDLRAYRLLFPDCTIIKERFFLLTKSMVAYRTLQ
jgi:hypothetical protein